MTTFDVIVEYDQAKAEKLYNFLKTARCTCLRGSNLELALKYIRPPAKAYKVRTDSKNKYEYLYSISKYETMELPIELDRFMERTIKI